MWIVLIFAFYLITSANSGYIERVTVSGCESCRLMLTCRKFTSSIAILNVNFKRHNENETLPTSTAENYTPFQPYHPRDALNQRCSGVNHCSFILTEDCPGADSWGLGTITIKYACVPADRAKKYCNTDVVLPNRTNLETSEGFIHNPGYPRFYSGQYVCSWRIKASPEQKIRFTFLDVSLIVDNVVYPEDCTDVLQIFHMGQVIHSTCRQRYPPLVITSVGNSVELVLKSSEVINPRRGILVHYSVIGCPTPDIPADGYLIHRNETVAEFSCCVGYVFPDSGKKRKTLYCLGAFWDTPLPLVACQKSILPNKDRKFQFKEETMAAELLAPIIFILALFVVNAIVLLYIYRMKQRQVIEIKDEELGAINTPTDQVSP